MPPKIFPIASCKPNLRSNQQKWELIVGLGLHGWCGIYIERNLLSNSFFSWRWEEAIVFTCLVVLPQLLQHNGNVTKHLTIIVFHILCFCISCLSPLRFCEWDKANAWLCSSTHPLDIALFESNSYHHHQVRGRPSSPSVTGKFSGCTQPCQSNVTFPIHNKPNGCTMHREALHRWQTLPMPI